MNQEDVLNGLREAFHSVAPEIEFKTIDLRRPLRGQVEIDSFDFFRIIRELSRKLGTNVPDSLVLSSETLEELISGISGTSSRRQPQSPVQ